MTLLTGVWVVTVTLTFLSNSVLAGAVERCQLDDKGSDGRGLACADGVLGDFDIGKFTSNATSPIKPGSTTGGGWLDPKICSGDYCVFANKDVAHGRGLSVITTAQNLQKIRRVQDRLDDPGNNRNNKEPPQFNIQDINGEGLTLVANQSIKRGEAIMAWSPVLMIRKTFFDDVDASKQELLLAAAFQLLPDATRKAFQGQTRVSDAGKSRVLKDVILRHSFESDVGWPANGRPNELHYVSHPEVAVFKHNCRPNVAYYIDGNHVHHTMAARRVQPGEELTISRINDPLLTRLERQRFLRKWKGSECSCSLCSSPKESSTLTDSDKRLKEIKKIQAKLSDHESKGVTTDMIARFIKLYKEEHLETRLADAYELAALNYNYLGYTKEAVKYATLSAQAGSIEGGVNSNNVIAMRIMAKDPKGHYSYRMKLKK
ncbi:hypothetical protein BR93DRAFT_955549 [Coniochaeta sp. PMI_546]|nr:hypothetical protein BR93DRAFT_955549 [Coniochaeta sp. PMI_546]